MESNKALPENVLGNTIDGALIRGISRHTSDAQETVLGHTDQGLNDPIFSEAKEVFDLKQEFPVIFLQRRFK